MKYSKPLIHFTRFLTFTLLVCIEGALTTNIQAATTHPIDSKPEIREKLFSSPDEAIKALKTAVESDDQSELQKIFGPEFRELLTGDRVQDANNIHKFADAMNQGCKQVKEGKNTVVLELGKNEWPMPIPLLKSNGKWHFDTTEGKEEIINRHIGKGELYAIGVCHDYVTAQKQYAKEMKKEGNEKEYAQKFKSTPGKRDGLYWPATKSEPASPFGPLVAEAHAEGYVSHKDKGPHPFHGYYFKILTQQGSSTPGGKMNYLHEGHLIGGFALVAYPVIWEKSGIMTFVVNQDGKVFQKDLGEETQRIAGEMKEYNPDPSWTRVKDKGIWNAIFEK
ncbi:MAG: DUF2950 domain-containing protein [Verrucomicrobiota bacterium]